MKPVLTIAGVELRRFVRDRSNVFFVFVFPLLLVVLIGAQFAGSQSGRVAVSGPGSTLRSELSGQLRVEELEVWYDDASTVRDQLARGRADVGVFLDAGDASAYARGRGVDLQVVVAPQATAQATAEQVRAAVTRVRSRWSQRIALQEAGMGVAEVDRALQSARTASPAPRLRVTELDETAQEFSTLGRFDLGATTQTLLFVFLSTVGGAAALIQSRRYRVLQRMMSTPLSAGQAVAGQALGRFALAMVQGLYLMLGTAAFFGVDWGSWPAALLVLAMFGAVAAALAMVVGTVMDNEGAATGVGIGAGLVLAALGGCMTPLEFFPDTLRTIAHVTPHAWAYEAFAKIQRHGAGVADVLPQLGVLAGMAVVLLATGGWVVRRSLYRAL